MLDDKRKNKKPDYETDAIPAIDSGNVSFGRSGFFRFLLNNGKDVIPELGSAHQVEHAAPACFSKKMSQHVNQEADTVRHGGALVLIFRCIK